MANVPERDPIEGLNEALEGLAIEGGAAPDRDIGGLIAVRGACIACLGKHFECDSELNWRRMQ